MTSNESSRLSFVSCASNLAVLNSRLLASPCLQPGRSPLTVHFNSACAAHGFNASMKAAAESATGATWLVWLHQDVLLPPEWEIGFSHALDAAVRLFPKLAVAGVYGMVGAGAQAKRAGHVLDRGTVLREETPLPCLVDSLDELLFAVRVDTGLQLDPALGFDFYATDLVLQAQQCGWQCAVLDAYCEHWSDTPARGAIPDMVAQRVKRSAQVFEAKWASRLPISTPCFEIAQAGDVEDFIESIRLTT